MADNVPLSAAQARRIALRSQRLGSRPHCAPGLAHVRDVVAALGAIQLDAITTVTRSHYLVLFSRLGSYEPSLLDELVYRRREAFEYWGHAVSYLPMELYPAMRWRMAFFARQRNWQAVFARVERERPGYVAAIEAEVSASGPLAFSELHDSGRRARPDIPHADWFRWSDGKTVLDALVTIGRLAVADRRSFERVYDLVDRVISERVLAEPTPAPADAQRVLVLRAMAALGVATGKDVASYFKLPISVTRQRLAELVAAGELMAATVEGWDSPAFLWPDVPSGPVDAHALLSPFDSLIWDRDRTRRLFGFEYSLETYLKPEKRRYGYFVLPFLLAERLVARVDLKVDRQARALRVLGAYQEPGASATLVAAALGEELRLLAQWLALERIEVAERGDLSGHIRPLALAP